MGRVQHPGRAGGVAGQGLVHALGGQQVGQGVLVVAQGRERGGQRGRERRRAPRSAGTAVATVLGSSPARASPSHDGRRADDRLGRRPRRRCRSPSRPGRRRAARRSADRPGVDADPAPARSPAARRAAGPGGRRRRAGRPSGPGRSTGRWRRSGRPRRRERGAPRAGPPRSPPGRSRERGRSRLVARPPTAVRSSHPAERLGSTATRGRRATFSTTPQPPSMTPVAVEARIRASLSAATLSAHAVHRWVARSSVSGSSTSSSSAVRVASVPSAVERLVEGAALGRRTGLGCATTILPWARCP